ncbi:BORG1 protein, partial [Nothoprocta ornata]|nr:BORG1 protein [Nothoprocta ornata]
MSAKALPKRSGRKGRKEKPRDPLSCDMISAPLGDFRHTIHVGSGGERDSFGDVSFLQGKFHLLPAGAGPGAFPLPGRDAENASPLLKNAVSLPALPAAPPKPPRLLRDEDPGGGAADVGTPGTLGTPHAGSLLSLHVDLGPSILEDVLRVMEKHRDERRDAG